VLGIPDSQDPYYGQIPLAALVREPFEHAYAAIVNNEIAFLNNPPIQTPPRDCHLHLCYAAGYSSVDAVHADVKSSPRQQAARVAKELAGHVEEGREGGRSTHAATVKALCALLLEDWRYISMGLPVRFYLHLARTRKRGPQRYMIDRPGIRWRDEAGGVPPTSLVGALLRRHSRLELDARPPSARSDGSPDLDWELGTPGGGIHWYCGIASSLDLQLRQLATNSWGINCRELPGKLQHLIVVDKPSGEARIFRLTRSSIEGYVRNGRVLPFRHQSSDLSFQALRSACLDLVLDILEAAAS
jgi:hypothetical protein